MRVILFFLLLVIPTIAFSCNLTMGYRTSAKPPFINEFPDDAGFYKEFYSIVVQKIGCSLTIVRQPKKRVYRGLEKGIIDFYPRLSIKEKRAVFIYFMDIGFESYHVGLSRNDLAEITHLQQLNEMLLISTIGASNPLKPEWGVKRREVPSLDIDKAILMLRKNRGDFYIYDYLTIKHYFNVHNISDLKIHNNCCKKLVLRSLGFSRKSKFYNETSNSNYDSSRKVSAINFPTIINPNSIAAKFEQVIHEMGESGETQRILEKYVGKLVE